MCGFAILQRQLFCVESPRFQLGKNKNLPDELKNTSKRWRLVFGYIMLQCNSCMKSMTHWHHQTFVVVWKCFSKPSLRLLQVDLFFGGISVFSLYCSKWNACLIGFKSGGWLGQSRTVHFPPIDECFGCVGQCVRGSPSYCGMRRWPMSFVHSETESVCALPNSPCSCHPSLHYQ